MDERPLNGKTKPQAGTAKPKTLADDLEDFSRGPYHRCAKNAGQTRSRAEAVTRNTWRLTSQAQWFEVHAANYFLPDRHQQNRCTPRKPKRDPKDYPLL